MPSETKISFSDGSSTETLRKYSDDYSRKHLADLVEADEEAESYGALLDRAGRQYRKASTSSTYSVTSMDALWERHPRKLSEAGLRRSSDHSVVLTEDTDSFIIGERVWVGGGKPGQIAYIGETQFAPGDWAGIVLDDPIGKNDGSVAGVRYFQCEERRGVFSRLTRLTRAPLYTPRSPHAASPASDAGSVFVSSASATPSARQRRALSPNGSIRSAISSKMNMSVTSTANGGELRLGERVIVSSSQGSKAGTLRYAGPTDFAAGVWCGVELDDPIGKNDGSVEGKRYFECSARFGLFAPASKVSRSPSNRKPGACAIHSNGRSLRRSNSRESLTSLGTSIASSVRTASRVGLRPGVTTLGSAQELLREKQHHLERLMRERELERAEVAKVTLQVERVQAQLAHALKHSTVAASENESLKAELLKVNKQLEDERQRAEDLLFRTEEDNIHKEDYNKFKKAAEEERAASHKRIQDLEAEVALLAATTETARASIAAASDKHTAEMDQLASQHREEIHAAQMLSAELQKLLDEAYSLLKEKENEKDSLGKSMTEELSKLRTESEKSLKEAKSKLAVAQTELEAQMSVLNAKLQMAETKLETEKQNAERLVRDNSHIIAELNTKITQTQAALDDKTQELNKVLGLSKEQELSLSKEITKLKMELSSKILDIEQLTENNKKFESSCKSLESEITNLKEDFTKKMNEYESLLNETSQQNDKYSLEILELQQNLTMRTNEIEKILNESKDSSVATTKLVKEYKDIISERDKEIDKLKQDYEEITANFNKSHSIIAEEHKKLIEERDLQIEKLTKEIDNHQQIIEKNKVDFDALTLKVDNSDDEIKNLIIKNNELNETINKLNKTITELNAKISTIELQKGELERQLNSSNEKCSELQKAKEKIEAEYMNLTSHSTNSNDEISKLSQYLRETEKELQELRDKLREKSNNHERIEQELNQQIAKLNQDFTNERENSNQTLFKVQEELKAAEKKVKELDEQLIVLKDQYNKQEISHVTAVSEKTILEKEIEAMKVKETVLQSQLHDLNSKSEQTIEDFKHKIDILKADGETSEVKLKEKVDQLVEAQNDLNNRLEQAQKNEEFLQKKLEEVSYQFNHEKLILNQDINKRELELSKIKEEIQKSTSENAYVTALTEEKENIIKELNLKLAMLEVDLKSNIEVITEKERQVSVSTQELSEIKEQKQLLEQKFNASNSELNNLLKIYESLVIEKRDIDITLKEHQEKIDQLLKHIHALTQEKSSITQKNEELSETFAKINTKHQELLEQIQLNHLTKTELSNLAQEKDNLIKAKTEKLLEVATQVQALQVDRDNMHEALKEKSMAIEDRDKRISQLQESLQLNKNDFNLQVETLNKDIENINNKHKTEVEYLQNKLKHIETSSVENEGNIEILNKKDVEIVELQSMLTKAESDIKQLSNINDGQKANYEDLNKHLQADYDQLKKDSKKERRVGKEKLEEFKKLLEESKAKINGEVRKQCELQSRLDESEKRALELANKVELLTVHQKNTSTDQDQLLEKITLELQDVRKSTADTITSHELMINKLKIDIENKVNDLLKKDDLIAKLEEELKNQKVKTELAQREKHLIQQESAIKQKDNINNLNLNYSKKEGQGDENTLKLVEEKELVEGQVEFLNSVIVDMQRKNEQLLARVHALETGFTPDTPTDNKFHFESKREVAPRLFCDICDVFDAHDTEDCPRQAGERTPSPPTTAPPGTARKPPPPPRPYCDICEVFGHTTENCDEEETF